MINAAIVGLGWWGKNIVNAVQDKSERVIRRAGGKIERQTFEPVDSLRAEFDAFADAVAGRTTYPIPMEQMVNTIASFEAVVKSLDTDAPVTLD